MLSKIRVKKAIHFDSPDRVPFMGYNTPQSFLHVDFFPILPIPSSEWQPRYPYYPHTYEHLIKLHLYRWGWQGKKVPKKWLKKPRIEIDEWGCYWKSIGDGTVGHPYKPAFKNWSDLSRFELPLVHKYGFTKNFSLIAPTRYKLGLIQHFFFERSSFLRGFNNLLVDFRKNPQKVKDLLDKMKKWYVDSIKSLRGCHGIITGDDLGTQNNAIMSPEIFKKFYYDVYAEVIELTHKLGMDFILHSCGNVKDLIPIFIELGVDAMDFDSPHMVGIKNIGKFSYKKNMAFFCCVNIQSVYPNGTPRDVYKEVYKMIKYINTKEGGLIFKDYIDAHTSIRVPMKNIKSYWRGVKKYGKI